jgi:VanZ family protein
VVPSPTAGRSFASCTVQFFLPSSTTVELLANVALVLPAALFATLALRRPLVVLAAATGCSAAVEAVQALVPAIGRACGTNDWLMNTIGIAVGVALATATLGSVRAATNPAPGRSRSDIEPAARV